MKLVRPVNEEKLLELEQELAIQKKRFNDATQASLEKLKDATSLLKYIEEYPLQSAGVLFVAGFMAIQVLQSGKSRLTPQ